MVNELRIKEGRHKLIIGCREKKKNLSCGTFSVTTSGRLAAVKELPNSIPIGCQADETEIFLADSFYGLHGHRQFECKLAGQYLNLPV